jgi:hypothetical protein
MQGVERRKQSRIKFETNLTIEILGDHPPLYQGSNKIPGLMVDVSTDGLRFLSPIDVEPGTAIRIDREAEMILGEVCYAEPHGEDQFHLGILFRQVLANLRDLEPLLRTLQSFEEDSQVRKPNSNPSRL